MPRLFRTGSRGNRAASPGRMEEFEQRRTDGGERTSDYDGDGTLRPLKPLRSQIQHQDAEQRSISPILGALFRHVDQMSDTEGTPINAGSRKVSRNARPTSVPRSSTGAGAGAQGQHQGGTVHTRKRGSYGVRGNGTQQKSLSTGRVRPPPKYATSANNVNGNGPQQTNLNGSAERLTRAPTLSSQTSLRKLAYLSRAQTTNDVTASQGSAQRPLRAFGASKGESASTLSDITTDSRNSATNGRRSVDLKARKMADQQQPRHWNGEPLSPNSAPSDRPSQTHLKTTESVSMYQRIRSANYVAGGPTSAAPQQLQRPASEIRRRRGTPTITDINIPKRKPANANGNGAMMGNWVDDQSAEGMSPRENVAAHLGRNKGTSLDSTIAASSGKVSPLQKKPPRRSADQNPRNSNNDATADKATIDALKEEVLQLRKDLTHVIGQRNEAQKKADRLHEVVQEYREHERAHRSDSIASSTTGSVNINANGTKSPTGVGQMSPPSPLLNTPVADLVSQINTLKVTNTALMDRINALEKEKRSMWRTIARDEHSKSGRNLAGGVRTSVEL